MTERVYTMTPREIEALVREARNSHDPHEVAWRQGWLWDALEGARKAGRADAAEYFQAMIDLLNGESE